MAYKEWMEGRSADRHKLRNEMQVAVADVLLRLDKLEGKVDQMGVTIRSTNDRIGAVVGIVRWVGLPGLTAIVVALVAMALRS